MTGGIPPQLLMQLAQMMKNQQPQGGAALPPMPMMQPGMPGAQQPPQGGPTQMPQLGGNNATLSGGTAIPQVTGNPMTATPGYQKGGVAARGIGAIPGAAIAITQKLHNDKVQKTRAMVNEWIALQMNPSNKKAMEDAAKGDPALQKILQKKEADFAKMYHKAAADPGSPEAQGIQLAYKDQQGKEDQQIKVQQAQAAMQTQAAEAQQRMALAQRQQSESEKIQKQTEQMGKVTEKDAAANKVKEDAIKARGEQVTAQIQAKLTQVSTQTKAMLEATKIRASATVTSASIRASGTVRAAQARQSQADKYIQGEYKSLNQQLTELDRDSAALMKQLKDDTHWYGDDDAKADVQQKLAQIDAQRQMYTQQFQMLQMKDKAFQQTNVTPPPTTTQGGVVIHKME
jgi:hypothetical protein